MSTKRKPGSKKPATKNSRRGKKAQAKKDQKVFTADELLAEGEGPEGTGTPVEQEAIPEEPEVITEEAAEPPKEEKEEKEEEVLHEGLKVTIDTDEEEVVYKTIADLRGVDLETVEAGVLEDLLTSFRIVASELEPDDMDRLDRLYAVRFNMVLKAMEDKEEEITFDFSSRLQTKTTLAYLDGEDITEEERKTLDEASVQIFLGELSKIGQMMTPNRMVELRRQAELFLGVASDDERAQVVGLISTVDGQLKELLPELTPEPLDTRIVFQDKAMGPLEIVSLLQEQRDTLSANADLLKRQSMLIEDLSNNETSEEDNMTDRKNTTAPATTNAGTKEGFFASIGTWTDENTESDWVVRQLECKHCGCAEDRYNDSVRAAARAKEEGKGVNVTPIACANDKDHEFEGETSIQVVRTAWNVTKKIVAWILYPFVALVRKIASWFSDSETTTKTTTVKA